MKKSGNNETAVTHAMKDGETHHQTHAKKATSKKIILPIAIAVIALLIIGGGLWFFLGKGASTMNKDVVAKVNGEKVYQADVDTLMQQGQQQNVPFTQDQAIQQLVTKQLLLQEAKKNKVTVDDAAVDKYIKDLEGVINQPIDAVIQKMGISKDEFRDQIRKQLTITNLLTAKVPQETSVTDQEIQAFYTANEQYMTVPEQVNASHILLATEQEANAVLDQLKAGADFGKLAREKSIDPSAKTNNGNLGFFAKGQMVAEFENVAFSLAPGQVSIPVKSQFGYHIIAVYAKQPAQKLTVEQAKEDLRKLILQQKNQAKLNAYVKELTDKAKIEYTAKK